MTADGSDRGDPWWQAHQLVITGRYVEARRALEGLRADASGSWSASEQMAYHAAMANLAHKTGRYEEMLSQAEHGLALSRPSLPALTAELHAWTALANTMLARMQAAGQAIDAGLALVTDLSHDPRSTRARCLVYRAVGNLRAAEGRLREAVEAAETSLRAAEEIDDPWEASIARYDVGEAYALLGQHATAMRYLDAAGRDKEAVGDRWGLAYVHRSKLRIYLDRGQFEEALESVEIGMTIARELEDPKLLAMIEVEWGQLLLRRGELKTAAALAEAALHRARQCRAPAEEINAVVLAGNIALARGQNESAVKFADVALRTAEEAQLYRELAASQKLAALALCRCGRIEDARTALDFMMPLVKALGNPYRRLELEVARIEVDLASGVSAADVLVRIDQLVNRALGIQAGWKVQVLERIRERLAPN